MSNPNNRILDSRTHGLARTFLVSTRRNNIEPGPIICISSFFSNLFEDEFKYESDDPRYVDTIRIHYSRNNGPIQQVSLSLTAPLEDVRQSLIQLDRDLVRGTDGESMAFYIDTHQLTHRDTMLVDVTRSDNHDEQLDFTISGVDSDGLLSRKDMYVIDTKKIAITKPESVYVEGSGNAERWYPDNTIVQEENKLVIYPVEDLNEHDVDMFTVFGGVNDTPLTIHSCAVTVPNKHHCLATSTRIAEMNQSELFSLPAGSENNPDTNQTEYEFTNYINKHPYPFNMSGDRNYDTVPTVWPDRQTISERRRSEYHGCDFVCTFSKNGSPLKTIIWNTSNDVKHHSVWDAIKEMFLDEQGRTAFVFSGFNRDDLGKFLPPTLHGISSDGSIGHRDNAGHIVTPSFKQNASAFEIKDRVIAFAEQNEGLSWSENTITFHPTPVRVAIEYGFDEYVDYYSVLCEFEEQVTIGEPITIHSCAVVEPVDCIRPSTTVYLDKSGLDGPEDLSASIQINDEPIKTFRFEAADMEAGIVSIFEYINYMGAPIKYTPSTGPTDDFELLPEHINMQYFRQQNIGYMNNRTSISGCSGSEYPDEYVPEILIYDPTDVDNPYTYLEGVILLDEDSPVSMRTEVNKVTFIKNNVSGYLDFFNMLSSTTGDKHVIYSTAAIPSIVVYDPSEKGEVDPVDPEVNRFTFRTSSNESSPKELAIKVNVTSTGEPWALIDTVRELTIADETTYGNAIGQSIGIYLDSTGAKKRSYTMTGRVANVEVIIEEPTSVPGAVDILSFSDTISEYTYDVKNAAITVPTILPAHVTVTDRMFAGCTNIVQDISNWDVSHVTSMVEMFDGCTNFNQDISTWDVSSVTTLKGTFNNCFEFNQDLSNWNVSNVVDLSFTFGGCTMFNQPLDLWNVAKVTTLYGTFRGASAFDQPLSSWNTQMVTTMRECFAGVNSFNQPLNNWNVSSVIDMQYMFSNATSFNQDLPSWNTASLVNLEGTFKDAIWFNGNISTWNTSRVEILSSTFQNACRFNQPLNDWDTSQVGTMQSTFLCAETFDQPLNNWDVSNVRGSFPMYGMFEGATVFNQDLSNWCVPNIEYVPKFDEGAVSWSEPRPPWGYCGLQVVSSLQFTITTGDVAADKDRLAIGFPEGMPGTFKILKDGVLTNTSSDGYDSDIMNQYGGIAIYVPPNTTRTFTLQASAPVAQFKYYTDNTTSTNKITIDAFSDNILRYEFAIQNADLTVPQTLPVHITSMFAMFKDSNKFNQDLSGWDVSRITNTTDAFKDCASFNGDLNTWRFDSLTNATRMFYGCTVFNSPIGDWTTPKLKLANFMFQKAIALNQDLSNWDVSSIWNFEGMFYGCTSFNGDITSWNMVGTVKTNLMFYAAQAFNQPIGSWNMASVGDMSGMFQYAIGFNQDISAWDTSGIKNTSGMSEMFAQTIGFNQDLSTWNVLTIPAIPYQFDVGTVSWALRRPIWGTDGAVLGLPEYTPMELNISTNDVDYYSTAIRLEVHGLESDYVVVIDDTIHVDANTPHPFVTITKYRDYDSISINDIGINKVVNFKFYIKGTSLILKSTTSNNIARVDMLNFSDHITRYRFYMNDTPFAAPTVLPPHITILDNMFDGGSYNQDLSGWDTSHVTSMVETFMNCDTFNSPLDTWDVSNVTSMKGMFYRCMAFNQPLNSWQVNKVTDMTQMFYSCRIFNQPLNSWNTTNVTNMHEMFSTARIFNDDISTWDVSNVTNMDNMFYQAIKFNSPIGQWNVGQVLNMDGMFREALEFNQDLSGWNVVNILEEPYNFDFGVDGWILPKPTWGTNGTPSDLPWSVTDTTVDQDVVDVNATKRINGVAYKSNIKYTPSNVAIKEAIANEDSTLLVTNVLNKLIGNVSNWTLDLNNNRIVYN